MCAICHMSRCPAGCPNATDTPALHTCKRCDEGIITGDKYAEIDGCRYHIECLEDMTTRELLTLLDIEVHMAESEGAIW